jgi:hypothetical protein
LLIKKEITVNVSDVTKTERITGNEVVKELPKNQKYYEEVNLGNIKKEIANQILNETKPDSDVNLSMLIENKILETLKDNIFERVNNPENKNLDEEYYLLNLDPKLLNVTNSTPPNISDKNKDITQNNFPKNIPFIEIEIELDIPEKPKTKRKESTSWISTEKPLIWLFKNNFFQKILKIINNPF